MTKASIGTISHGTLRSEDLIEAFANEIERLGAEGDHAKLVNEGRAVLTLIECAWSIAEDMSDALHDLVNAMMDALDAYAPSYCYFGTLEGDGSDFGFWPSLGAIEDLPKFNDLSDVPDDNTEDYVVVNDHGNVSVYGGDNVLIWDCV